MHSQQFLRLHITLSICKVGDCGLQTYQAATILKRATTPKFTTISPILYIHCYVAFFFFNLHFLLSTVTFSPFTSITCVLLIGYSFNSDSYFEIIFSTAFLKGKFVW